MIERLSGVAAWLALALAVAGPCGAQAQGLHRPETPAERELDAILRRVEHDPQAMDNLVGGRGPGFHRTVDYRTSLTAPLLAAIAAREKALVAHDCAGRYRSGESCGLDYNPVTCAQDSNPTYFYRTESESADRAQIAYQWPYSQAPQATFRLIRQEGVWKIDGIRCKEGDAFNMS